ncbi:MAG: OprO/OprP family phosphate-selective porin [Pseudomonadales bacterium]
MSMKLCSTTLLVCVFMLCQLLSSANAVELERSPSRGLDIRIDDQIRLSAGIRLQADAVRFGDDRTSLENDADFRRARLTSTLDWSAWRLRADYDYGISEGWKNLFVQYRGLNKQRITLGNQIAPFLMEDMTSSQHLPLMERSIASALNPGTLLGVSYHTWGDRWSLKTGVFGDELSDLDRRTLPGKSVNGRFTVAPVRHNAATLHIGIAGEYRQIDDDESVRLRARPGTRLTDRRLVNTGRIADVDQATNVGLELAVAHKNVRLQSEVVRTTFDGLEDFTFDSHLLMASVVFGGESYRYSHSRGVFDAAQPNNRWGAIELAARIARLDLSDGSITGGVQTERTVGVSWIPNQKFRAMLNYSDIEASPNRKGADEDVSVLLFRLQMAI